MTTAALSPSRLARMHDTMNGHVARGDLPGLVTLVCRRGEVHVDAIGHHAVDGSKPMQRDTLFRIASMSKPITAVATMILIEEGRLRLDDPVDLFLPELANRRVLARIDAPIDETVPAQDVSPRQEPVRSDPLASAFQGQLIREVKLPRRG